MSTDSRRSTLGFALIAAAVAVLGNLRILGQFFWADDFANLFEVANDASPWEFLVMPALGHMHILRNAALYLNFVAFRMHASWFFATMLANHVVNVLLLFAVARRLTGSAFLACFAAVLFAISPQNPGTLGWYAVNGHAMATTFVLATLLLLVDEDDRRPLRPGRALAVAACAIGASQSFGNGAGVALALPLVVLLLRPGFWRNLTSALVVCLVPLVVALAMWLLLFTTTRLNPAAGVQTSVLLHAVTDWVYVVPMLLHLASVGCVTLLLGSAYPIDRYPDTLSAAVTVGFAIALAVGLARGDGRDRRRLGALLLVCVVSYGAIAAGRASILAAFRTDTWVSVIANATRYYYLGQAAFALLVAALLGQFVRRASGIPRWGTAVLAVWMGCVVVAQLLWPSLPARSEDTWTNVVYLRGKTEHAIRRTPPGSVACLPNKAAPFADGFPGTFGVYVLYNPEDVFEGRRVYFTTSDRRQLALRIPGSRAESLLVPEGQCPPSP